MTEKFITIYQMPKPGEISTGTFILEAVAEHLGLKNGQPVPEDLFRKALQENGNYGIAKCELNIAMEKGLPE